MPLKQNASESDSERGTEGASLPNPSGLSILLALFLRPALALVTVQVLRRWLPAFAGLFLVIVLACTLSTCSSYGRYSREVVEILETVSPDVVPLSFENGVLNWNSKVYPLYRRTVNDCEVEFVHEPSLMSGDDVKRGKAKYGVIVTPHDLSVWMDWAGRTGGSGGTGEVDAPRRLFGESQFRMIERSLARDGLSSLNSGELLDMGRMMCVAALPVVFMVHGFNYCWSILFCTVVFAFCTVIFNREMIHGLSDILIMSLNSAFPPTIMSMAWYAAMPRGWNFQNVYFVAFMIYILIVIFDAKKVSGRSDEK